MVQQVTCRGGLLWQIRMFEMNVFGTKHRRFWRRQQRTIRTQWRKVVFHPSPDYASEFSAEESVLIEKWHLSVLLNIYVESVVVSCCVP